MHRYTPNFHFKTTCIGSIPFQDIEPTCRKILEDPSLIPFWPQFVQRSYLEDMIIQYNEALPLIQINKEKKSLSISASADRESELVTFYDRFLAQDIDYFAISRTCAPGLYAMNEIIKQDGINEKHFIKGQTVGPVTFAAAVTSPDGKSIIHDPELLEAMTNGLAIKGLWQIMELKKSGKRPIIFLDEPYLSGFGSAFNPLQRHEVINILQSVINYLRENSDTLIGIHCCGNTDWAMLIEAGPDIINFDAYEYMDYFLLYPDDIVRFIREGGTIAWGIVPTSNFTGNETVEDLASKLDQGLKRIHEWGISPDTLAERSILTPACGMGTMTPEAAKRGLDLLSGLSLRLREG